MFTRTRSRSPQISRTLLALTGFLLLGLTGWANAEPPSRVARLGYIDGTVSFSPAGQPDWVQAAINRPLTTGDRLWSDADSRAELQIGGAAIRLGANTSVNLLNLDDRIAQVQLSEGTLKVRVRRMGANQAFEINTPNLAFTLRRPGEYRIDVDANGDSTAVRVQSGLAEVYGDGASYTVTPQQGYRFYGTGLSDYDRLAARPGDALDRWASERDRRYDKSSSARYVSSDVVGYEDLDANGSWRRDPEYGNVWSPNGVVAGWTPYRDGHWSWVDPWGWTWVDDAPWGYAVSHYGRWASINDRWSWVPGPPRERAVYAPALVGFVGGNNFQASSSVGSLIAAALVGWFPLAPREVYQPSYPVSRAYFDNINRSNAVIAPATITNVYNTTMINRTTIVNNTTNTTNINRTVYANQRVRGAVVAVPAQAFVQSRPVARAAVAVSREAASAPVVHVAAVAPERESVHGGGRESGSRPPARERAVVARTAPPPPPVAFSAQQKELAAQPGTPVNEDRRKQMRPTAPAVAAPAVSVVNTVPAPAPTAAPPATPPAPKSPDARKEDTRRADAGKGDRGDRGDNGRRDGARGDAGKADAAKADAGKADAMKADAAKADAAKADATKAAAGKAEATRAETAKADAARSDALKADAMKADAAKAASAKADASRADAAKAESARAEAARNDAAKADAAKAANAKAEASRVDAAKAESAKAEAARADAAKADAARAANAKAEASRADAAKADAAARADAAKAANAKAEAARVDAAKADATKAESARAEAARAESARAETARAANAKAEASRADAAKAENARAESARAESARADAARAANAKAEAARADAAKADAAKAESAKAEAARAEAAKVAAAKAAAAKADAAKAEAATGAEGKAEPRARPPRGEPDAKGDEEPDNRRGRGRNTDTQRP